MTADLELFLRGLYINRWRCRHVRFQFLPFWVRYHDHALYCQDCEHYWLLADQDKKNCRSQPELDSLIARTFELPAYHG